MFKIFLIHLFLCSKLVTSWKSKVDYCKVKCPGFPNVEHTACKCELVPPRKIITNDIEKFRKDMVDLHNEYRNKVASGGEKHKGYPTAANMMALRYDLEVEYTATCLARKYKGDNGNGHHDVCRVIANSTAEGGQNIAGNSADYHLVTNATGMAWRWYNELNFVNEPDRKKFIEKFYEKYSQPNKDIGHFSQFVWWSHRFVGCARVHYSELKDKSYTNSLICNYAGATKYNDAGNMVGQPVYKVGEPCSGCPKSDKCNPKSKYPSLCGAVAEEDNKVPQPLEKPSRTACIYQNKLFLSVVIVLGIMLNYKAI